MIIYAYQGIKDSIPIHVLIFMSIYLSFYIYEFFHELKYYFWEEPLLFHLGYDQIIRRCVPEEEQGDILAMCHSSTCGGHFAARKTAHKILQSGFYWPSITKDAHCFYTECLQCKRQSTSPSGMRCRCG